MKKYGFALAAVVAALFLLPGVCMAQKTEPEAQAAKAAAEETRDEYTDVWYKTCQSAFDGSLGMYQELSNRLAAMKIGKGDQGEIAKVEAIMDDMWGILQDASGCYDTGNYWYKEGNKEFLAGENAMSVSLWDLAYASFVASDSHFYNAGGWYSDGAGLAVSTHGHYADADKILKKNGF